MLVLSRFYRSNFHLAEDYRPGICKGMTNLLDVVVGQGSAILELLAGEDQSLLVRGDALLVLDLGLDIVNGVGGLDLKGDGLAREGLDEDLHYKLEEATVSVLSRQRNNRSFYDRRRCASLYESMKYKGSQGVRTFDCFSS